MTAAILLADSDTGKGSPIGLLVVLLLVIAVYFLWRSMNRHLKKVQPPADMNFDEASQSKGETAGEQPGKIENGPQPKG